MSTDQAAPIPAAPIPDQVLRVARVESVEARRRRFATGALLAAFAAVIVLLGVTATHGTTRIALTSNFADKPLSLPGQTTVLLCGIVALALALVFMLVPLPLGRRRVTSIAFGLLVVVGFIAWSAAGRDLPFQLSNQLVQTIVLATPLMFGALAGSVGERAGVINVAIEGHFLAAAFLAWFVGAVTGSVAAGLVGAMAAGLVMAMLLTVFALRYLVNQVVLGVVLNVLASGVTGFLYDKLTSTPELSEKYSTSVVMAPHAVPGLAKIPFIGPILFEQTALVYIAYFAIPLVWVLLFRTRWGLRVRAVGEHPAAADTVGINVNRTRYSAMMLAGLLAGLGGAFFTIGFGGSFTKDLTSGYGFIALAAVIMGRWHPISAVGMALFFGFVQQLQQQIGLLGTPIPQEVLQMFPYLATIIAVAGLVGKVRAPAADGEPYVKG